MSLTKVTIDVTKIRKEKDLFKPENGNGVFLTFMLADKKNGEDQYGKTHNVYIFDKEKEGNDRYHFIGSGTAIQPQSNGTVTDAEVVKEDSGDLPF